MQWRLTHYLVKGGELHHRPSGASWNPTHSMNVQSAESTSLSLEPQVHVRERLEGQHEVARLSLLGKEPNFTLQGMESRWRMPLRESQVRLTFRTPLRGLSVQGEAQGVEKPGRGDPLGKKWEVHWALRHGYMHWWGWLGEPTGTEWRVPTECSGRKAATGWPQLWTWRGK